MMFSEIIVKILILSLFCVCAFAQGVMEDIFYGENFIGKDIELKKLKEQLESVKNKESIPITNIQFYTQKNQTNLQNLNKIEKIKGDCNIFINLKQSFSEKSNFTKNLKSLETYLNDKNYLFNDKNGNIIVYSTCQNFIDVNCIPQFYFISKL